MGFPYSFVVPNPWTGYKTMRLIYPILLKITSVKIELLPRTMPKYFELAGGHKGSTMG
jgi:hypothetical protein